MIEYKESFNKIDVFYNGKNIGYITREAGFNNYFMYYNNGHSADLLDDEINKAKYILEIIIKQWEAILKN